MQLCNQCLLDKHSLLSSCLASPTGRTVKSSRNFSANFISTSVTKQRLHYIAIECNHTQLYQSNVHQTNYCCVSNDGATRKLVRSSGALMYAEYNEVCKLRELLMNQGSFNGDLRIMQDVNVGI